MKVASTLERKFILSVCDKMLVNPGKSVIEVAKQVEENLEVSPELIVKYRSDIKNPTGANYVAFYSQPSVEVLSPDSMVAIVWVDPVDGDSHIHFAKEPGSEEDAEEYAVYRKLDALPPLVLGPYRIYDIPLGYYQDEPENWIVVYRPGLEKGKVWEQTFNLVDITWPKVWELSASVLPILPSVYLNAPVEYGRSIEKTVQMFNSGVQEQPYRLQELEDPSRWAFVRP